MLEHLRANPEAHARTLGVIARTAPADAAREILLQIVEGAAGFAEHHRPKVYGEAAWALAGLGARSDASRIAALALRLPHVADGGTLTAIAAAARAGDLAAAERAAGDDVMRLDVAAYGAAVGGARDKAAALRRKVEANPIAVAYVRSAIHLKTLIALGDRAAAERVLRESTRPLFDAAAVAEAASQVRDPQAIALARRTILAVAAAQGPIPATSVAPVAAASPANSRIPTALLGVAGNAAAAGLRAELDETAAALAPLLPGLPTAAREDFTSGLALSYITIGDAPRARELLSQAVRHADAWMFQQELASLEGRWDAIQRRPGGQPLLAASVGARAIAAKLDPAAVHRVLDAICP
jgi:hypothetical protein